MSNDVLTKEEQETYDWLLGETKQERARHDRNFRLLSILAGVLISSLTMGTLTTITLPERLLMGAQFYSLFGAVLLAVGAASHPSIIALMTMTRCGGNPKLFAELMKTRFKTRLGIGFLVGGFLMQGIVTIIF